MFVVAERHPHRRREVVQREELKPGFLQGLRDRGTQRVSGSRRVAARAGLLTGGFLVRVHAEGTWDFRDVSRPLKEGDTLTNPLITEASAQLAVLGNGRPTRQ